MKVPFLLAALAAATAVSAAPPSPTAPATGKPSELQLAVQGLTLQLRDSVAPGPKPAPKPTPAQRAAMANVFRSEQPVRVERLSKPGAPKRERLTLPAGMYSGDGTLVNWQQATWEVQHSANGRQLDSKGTLPQLLTNDSKGTFTLYSTTFGGTQRRAADGLWFGTMHAKIDQLRFQARNAAAADLWQFAFATTVSQRNQSVDQAVEIGAARITAGDFTLEAPHLAYRIIGLDRATLRRMGDGSDGDVAQTLAQLKQLAQAGATMRIDDLSARYKGHTARLSGTLALPGVKQEDFDAPARLLRKLALKFDVHVPLGLVREVAGVMAAKNAAAAGPTGKTPGAGEFYEGIVGKAVANGYARIEGEALKSTIEWRDGTLRLNGKAIELPAPMQAALVEVPPQDTTTPQRVTMDTRKPDDVLAHALNGVPDALATMCRTEAARGPDGADAAVTWCDKAVAAGSVQGMVQRAALHEQAGDAAQALTLRRRAADQGDAGSLYALAHAEQDPETARELLRKAARNGSLAAGDELAAFGEQIIPDVETVETGMEMMRVQAGRWRDSQFRFDPRLRRDLVVMLSEPRDDAKWLPMLSVCVGAEAPSERVCLSLMQRRGDAHLSVFKRVHAVGEDSPRTLLSARATPGAPQGIRVFVQNDTVYMELNGERIVAEPASFPVEVIEVGCSTADCLFDFTK